MLPAAEVLVDTQARSGPEYFPLSHLTSSPSHCSCRSKWHGEGKFARKKETAKSARVKCHPVLGFVIAKEIKDPVTEL